MLNLFVNTQFNLAEEDRLTNAFMLVLANSDWSVQHAILSKMGVPQTCLAMEDELLIDLQTAFENSRPDAQITVSGYRIVIETKVGEALNDDQFTRHWQHLQNAESPTILLSLTKAFAAPKIVQKLSSESNHQYLTARHLSWSKVLHSVRIAKRDYPAESISGLLLTHFEEYLHTLGYYSLEGNIVEKLQNYGALIRDLQNVQAHTEAQLLGHLNMLKDSVMANAELPALAWQKKNFGRNAVSESQVKFTFLTADVPNIRGARYRLVPSMQTDGALKLAAYFTYNHKEGENEHLLSGLRAAQARCEPELTPLHHYGRLTAKPYLFHISRQYDANTAAAFFEGNLSKMTALGNDIGQFFLTIHQLLTECQA